LPIYLYYVKGRYFTIVRYVSAIYNADDFRDEPDLNIVYQFMSSLRLFTTKVDNVTQTEKRQHIDRDTTTNLHTMQYNTMNQ